MSKVSTIIKFMASFNSVVTESTFENLMVLSEDIRRFLK